MNHLFNPAKVREHIRNRADVADALRRQLADVERDIRMSEREIHEWKLSQIILLPTDHREYIELVWPVFIGGPCSEQAIVPGLVAPRPPEMLCAVAPLSVIDSCDFRSPESGEDPREHTATYYRQQVRNTSALYLGTRVIVAYAYTEKDTPGIAVSQALGDTLREGAMWATGGRKRGFRTLTPPPTT